MREQYGPRTNHRDSQAGVCALVDLVQPSSQFGAQQNVLPASGTRGFRGLLNLSEDRHVTVFLSDFDLPEVDAASILADLDGGHTRALFSRLDAGVDALRAALADAGVQTDRDYISLQVLACTEAGLLVANEFVGALGRGDFARLELPWRESGFQREQASALLRLVMDADYAEQERIAGMFFDLLGERSPYEVIVCTPHARLTIHDTAPWFDLGGRLSPGERRILPGGETAYVGAATNGAFTVDGAILAVAQRPHAAAEAARLLPLGEQVEKSPLTFHIQNGRVERVAGAGLGFDLLSELLEDEAYRTLTEVGIAFNHACARYEHRWAAAGNEGRPGVHIGLGGDPDPETDKGAAKALVHLDLMAATTEIIVNGRLFMKTSR